MTLSKTQPAVAAAAESAPRSTLRLASVLKYGLMAVIVIVMVLPFTWMLSTSLKSQEYILSTTPQLIPNPLSFSSYTELAQRIDLPRVFFNSLIVAGAGTLGQIMIAAMAAFAFARIEWRGRNTVFVLYLATPATLATSAIPDGCAISGGGRCRDVLAPLGS